MGKALRSAGVLEGEEELFGGEAAGIAGEAAVGADDTMAGYYD